MLGLPFEVDRRLDALRQLQDLHAWHHADVLLGSQQEVGPPGNAATSTTLATCKQLQINNSVCENRLNTVIIVQC